MIARNARNSSVKVGDDAQESFGSDYWFKYARCDYEFEAFDLPLKMIFCGMGVWHEDDYWTRRGSRYLIIEYVSSGSLSFEQEGRHGVVEPGEALILMPAASHTFKTGPTGFACKRCVAMVGPLVDSYLLSSPLGSADVVRPVFLQRFVALLKYAYKLLHAKADGFEVELSAAAYQILLELLRSTEHMYPREVRTTMEFIRQNISKPLTNEQITAVSGMSLTHLTRLFKSTVRVTPRQYLASQRFAAARHFLTHTHLSVKEIAFQTGFEDPLYFSKQFRKLAGKSPLEFRRSPVAGV